MFNKSFILLPLIVLTACAGLKEQQIHLDRVIANPVDVNYQFNKKPSPEILERMKSRDMMAGMPEGKPVAPDNLYPTDEELMQGMHYHMRHNWSKNVTAAEITGLRNAADPVMEYYKGEYWLFFSGAKGYFHSPDLQHWTHVDTFLPEGVAPTAMVYKDELYYITSNVNEIYKTSTPQDGSSWIKLPVALKPHKNDPNGTPYPLRSDSERGTSHDPYIFNDGDERVFYYWNSSVTDPIVGIEMDTKDNFLPLDNPKPLIGFDRHHLGYEIPGNRNEMYGVANCNEGAIMTKYNGKYYLQYATNGTEYDAYADGVYISDDPMGPFEVMKTGPASLKLGGFVTGAGHGDTFVDKYGNYWHIVTNIIGRRETFERRISFFPMVFTEEGNMYTLTGFGDYPFEIPDRKVDFLKEDIHTGWMNLSLNKAVTASSEQAGYEAAKAGDNTIKSWWAAQSGKPGEWLQMDLGHKCLIRAIQVNFADHNFGYKEDMMDPYRYIIEGSKDGKKWYTLADKSSNDTYNPHVLVVLDKAKDARYVRITNKGNYPGQFSMHDLRVFGSAYGDAPTRTEIATTNRPSNNPRRIQLSWEANPTATGYLLRWGANKNELYTSMEIYDANSVDLGSFISDVPYYFVLDTFNENGITRGTNIIEVK